MLNRRTLQIAMDGSQKLPQPLLPVIERRLERGQFVPKLSLAVAAGMKFCEQLYHLVQRLDLQDPLSDTSRGEPPDNTAADPVERLLATKSMFLRPLAHSEVFCVALVTGVERLALSALNDFAVFQAR